MTDQIEVVWGSAEGRTPLTAFDAALAEAGIHNYNLVPFSSVVPEDARIEERGRVGRAYDVGAPVGVVMAENESTQASETIAAGLGWVHADEGGVFMESTAGSAAACREDLRQKLADARELRNGWTWRTEAETTVREYTIEDTGALVVAAVFGPLAFTDEVSISGLS